MTTSWTLSLYQALLNCFWFPVTFFPSLFKHCTWSESRRVGSELRWICSSGVLHIWPYGHLCFSFVSLLKSLIAYCKQERLLFPQCICFWFSKDTKIQVKGGKNGYSYEVNWDEATFHWKSRSPRYLSWATLEISLLDLGKKFNILFYLNILKKVSVCISNINALI